MANWYIDPVTGVSTSGLSSWSNSTTYAADDQVLYTTSNLRKIYKSLQDSNTNHTPSSEPTWWEVIADGSNTLPFARETDTLALAMTSGDEYRHAKGPARTNITVNLTWTDGSTTVTATGTDVTGEIAVGDWICKSTSVMGATETVYSVSAISFAGGNTTITLSWKYYGTTETVASQKIGVIDCGTVSGTTVVHATQKDGTSAAPILHTGGWTLATETRDGETYYLQSDATIGGYCFSTNGKTDQTYQYLGALRFTRGFSWSSSASVRCTVEDCVASGGAYGIYTNAPLSTLTTCALNLTSSNGIYSSGASVQISGCTCNGGGGNGINASGTAADISGCVCSDGSTGIVVVSHYAYIASSVCNRNTSNGIYTTGASTVLLGCTCSSNAVGVKVTGGIGCVVTNLTAASNSTANLSVTAATAYATVPMLLYQRLNGTDAANGMMYEYGAAVNDEASERTSGQSSIKVTPTSADYGCDVLLAKAACADGVGNTLSVYAKDDVDHNGVVSMFIRGPMASITDGPTAQTLTTSWAQYTIAIDAADVPDDGVIELWARVTGTAGNVWFADPGVS